MKLFWKYSNLCDQYTSTSQMDELS